MRHFDVEDKLSGPIPVMGDPTQVNLPKTVKQAMASPFAKEWAEATVEEWLSLVGNNTWTLVEKKPFMKVIPCKWVYTVKTDGNGKLDRFKARLVAGGHRQIEGVDYNETYAPCNQTCYCQNPPVCCCQQILGCPTIGHQNSIPSWHCGH
jgi:hypothetical protein